MTKSKLEPIWTLIKDELPPKGRQVLLVVKSPNKKDHYLEIGCKFKMLHGGDWIFRLTSSGGTFDQEYIVAWSNAPKTFYGRKFV